MNIENDEYNVMIRRGLILLISVLTLWFLWQSFTFAMLRFYNLDEFRYAHAAWLVSEGKTPYIDFWDHKFPFLYQVLSLLYLFVDSGPLNFQYMRLLMFPLMLITLFSAYLINRRTDAVWALLAPLLMLSIRSFVFVVVEIQPDAMAVAFFFSSIAILYFNKRFPWASGFFAGLLFTLSVWTSQKVFCYGLIFPVALMLDIKYNSYRKSGYLLGNPVAFISGSIVVLVFLFYYLVSKDALAEWYRWTIDYTLLKYKDAYPSYSRWRTFGLLWHDGAGIFYFAFVGLSSTIRSLRQKGKECWNDPDILVVMAFPLCFFVWFLQRGAWLFSLLPFFAILAIFAARGLVSFARRVIGIMSFPAGKWKLFTSLATILIMCHFVSAISRGRLEPTPKNHYQKRILKIIGEISDKQDPIYDNSGSYISRPHAYSPYFTNAMIRVKWADQISQEVPKAILKSGCTVFIPDGRHKGLPETLQKWIAKHFLPFNKDIHLWGKKFKVTGAGQLDSKFTSVREAKYFIRPAKILNQGRLRIDGDLIESRVFLLKAGDRQVRFDGSPGVSFEILWLPRNGEMSEGRIELIPGDEPYGMIRYW